MTCVPTHLEIHVQQKGSTVLFGSVPENPKGLLALLVGRSANVREFLLYGRRAVHCHAVNFDRTLLPDADAKDLETIGLRGKANPCSLVLHGESAMATDQKESCRKKAGNHHCYGSRPSI